MTENKRYNIKPSNIVEDAFYIKDDRRKHSFPTVDDKSHLIMYEKALNEQDNRITELEKENERLQNCIHRKRLAVKWFKRDYDKLYQLCLDKGFTEEELIKELDR